MTDLFKHVQPVIFILSFVLFGWNIQTPSTLNFDEAHYVPAAKELLKGNVKPNREHPPVGKYFIAAGIALLGDNSDGWRVMSALFGALTVVAVVALAKAWGLTLIEQWQVGVIAMCNQMIFVLARIAMLDVFMFFFSFAATALFFHVWLQPDPAKVRRRLIWCGIFFGIGAGCKWSAVFPWAMILGLVVVSPLLAKKKMAPIFPVSVFRWPLYLIVLPVFSYFLTFLPIWIIGNEPMNLWAILNGQHTMYSLQQSVAASHPYLSHWYSWPIMYRPVWLKFEPVQGQAGWVYASLLIGNLVIAWAGLPVFLLLLRQAFMKNDLIARLIALSYFCLWLPWAILSHRVQFLFYYTPAFIILSYACVYALRPWPRVRWGFVISTVVAFAYYYPVLAGMPVAVSIFRWWAWFLNWV